MHLAARVPTEVTGDEPFASIIRRSYADLFAERQKWYDLVWWTRSAYHMNEARARGHAEVEARYGNQFMESFTSNDWIVANGNLMALSWALGAEWNKAGAT
ncbi:hypothetical protein EAH89_28850 [Roseomonas nepalensis]|uniref:Uncharacterized protein n=1 Tax=Muricoccus nepalensis TaxID=1854500 RepID=A0A502EV71_9PROT|nr:hypothetical protein [Roseomonas nepalensis]TPG40974.1 hypothetical protein EAH89_28850 [Roseomonas nepalensis]